MCSRRCPGQRFEQRGLLKSGYFADITIFNSETIIDKGAFVDPIQFPEGIEYVLIIGRVALSEGRYCRELAGKVLRKSIS
jgi:N-acyl-D-amino-acid deacylase